MYRSAHYVLFVNYDDFFSAMDAKLVAHDGEDVWFFSGYDCDSLALDPLTGSSSLLLLPFFFKVSSASIIIFSVCGLSDMSIFLLLNLLYLLITLFFS